MHARFSFRVEAGNILAVVGPSGAGRSTLAQCINLPTSPTSGSVVVNGEDLTTLSNSQLRVARRLLDHVGLADRAGHYPYQLLGGQKQRGVVATFQDPAVQQFLATDPSVKDILLPL